MAAIVAALLEEAIYLCASRTMHRILAPRDERRDIARRASYQKLELLATKPHQFWSWDITKPPTHEKYFY